MTPQFAVHSARQSIPAGVIPSRPFDVSDVTLRHLRGDEIAQVLHLRDEIDLSVHAAAGSQQFATLEKKETKSVSSSASTSMAS
jgi:hypothetical protein